MSNDSIPIDNPAGRLHRILQKAKDTQETGQIGQAREGWAKVFDIPASFIRTDRVEREVEEKLIENLIQLRLLIDETERSLRDIEGLPERYLRPFPRIRQIPLTELNVPFGNYISGITEDTLTVLEFCAEELSGRHSEPVVDDDQLKELLEDVNALFDEIKTSTLPSDLKVLLLQELEEIRKAIQQYRIRGVERLREGLAAVTGSVMVNAELIKNGNQYEAVSKFKKVFFALDSVITLASKAAPLIEPIKRAIGLLMSGDHNVPPSPMN
jgi:hypothetical protein